MDVRQYYRKLREIESGIAEPFVLVSSLETSDGGRPGVISEVSREQAARLILEARVTLSSNEETSIFLAKRIADRRAIEKVDMARRLQVTIVSAADAQDSTGCLSVGTEPGVRI